MSSQASLFTSETSHRNLRIFLQMYSRLIHGCLYQKNGEKRLGMCPRMTAKYRIRSLEICFVLTMELAQYLQNRSC